MNWNRIKTQIAPFNTFATAQAASERTRKASIVLHGDDNLFWVVSLGIGARLVAAGYEIAERVGR